MIKTVFKIIGGFLLSFIIVVIIGILWPLPDISVPEVHKTTMLEQINIIDVASGEIIYNQEILIVENRIAAIDSAGKIKRVDDVFIIDGKGSFVIPGLWNMHNHSTQLSKWLSHPLQIANGVTGVRDMSGQLGRYDSYWAGTKERTEWNSELNNNQIVAPRSVLQSSFQVDGVSSVPDAFPTYFKLQNEEDVPLLLSYYKQEGADFIKTYMNIPASTYRLLANEAPNYGLYIAGHKPLNISLRESITLGQRSFEHGRIFMFDCFPSAEEMRDPKKRGNRFRLPKEEMIDEFDENEAIAIMSLMKERNAHWVPTLQTLKMSAFANDSKFVNNSQLKYIPWLRENAMWKPDINRYINNTEDEHGESLEIEFYQASQQQVSMAHKIGVPIMMGTDVTDTYVFPGFSAHAELKDLTESGLSSLEALRSATIIPAKYCGLEKEHGTVSVGKLADMVILSENPLEKIEYTRSINGVIHNGVYYDAEKIAGLKEAAASLASSFHINVKIAYSLISSPLMRVQFAD
jgi:hypothetical protein